MTAKVERLLTEDGEDQHMLMTFEKDGKKATIDIILKFDGDWRDLYDFVDETETAARTAVAEDIFGILLSEATV